MNMKQSQWLMGQWLLISVIGGWRKIGAEDVSRASGITLVLGCEATTWAMKKSFCGVGRLGGWEYAKVGHPAQNMPNVQISSGPKVSTQTNSTRSQADITKKWFKKRPLPLLLLPQSPIFICTVWVSVTAMWLAAYVGIGTICTWRLGVDS